MITNKPSKIFKYLNLLVHRQDVGFYIFKKIAKLKSWYILDRQKRKQKYLDTFNKYRTTLFGYKVLEQAKEIGEGFWCGGWSSVSSNTILKEHVSFNGMRMEGDGKVTIGRYFHSGTECLMITRSHGYDTGNKIPYDAEHHIYKDIEIGDFVWLGSRVMILPGTNIGEGAIIQGGSVVHGKIPPYAIAGGNPAKVFKYRDIEHFKKLKEEGKFY